MMSHSLFMRAIVDIEFVSYTQTELSINLEKISTILKNKLIYSQNCHYSNVQVICQLKKYDQLPYF
jgi:hypothetical protein